MSNNVMHGPAGRAFWIDAKGNPAWRDWSELNGAEQRGTYSFLVNGNPVTALGPPPALGTSNPRYEWKAGLPEGCLWPGHPDASVAAHITRAGGPTRPAAPPAPTPQAPAPTAVAGEADRDGWLASTLRVCGSLRPLEKKA